MNSEEGWAVDVVDSTVDAVRQAIAVLGLHGLEAVAVNPIKWLTWHLDRNSVYGLSLALRTALTTHLLPSEEALGIQSLLDDCDEWLRRLPPPSLEG